MATFDKKTVYHSALVPVSPLRVMLIGEVRPSKFAGKPPWIAFKVEGDEQEYQYTVENAACEAVLKQAPRNVWVTLNAAGSRDAAVLELVDLYERRDNGGGSGVSQHASGSTQGSAPGDSLAAEMFHALSVAADVVEQFRKRHGREPSETERAIAASLFIERNRSQRPYTR